MEGSDIVFASIIVVAIFNGLICAGFSFELAKHKGHDKSNALVFGFLFGLFALLFYVGLPDLKQRQALDCLNEHLERVTHLQ